MMEWRGRAGAAFFTEHILMRISLQANVWQTILLTYKPYEDSSVFEFLKPHVVTQEVNVPTTVKGSILLICNIFKGIDGISFTSIFLIYNK